MKLPLIIALLLTLDACQNPSRLQVAQSGSNVAVIADEVIE
jgi:hypothetical protein